MTQVKTYPKAKKKLKRNSVAWKRLVKEVFERDRYRCQLCDHIFPMNMLAPHHIKTVGAGGEDTKENLISQCSFCHYAIHNGDVEAIKKMNEIKESKS